MSRGSGNGWASSAIATVGFVSAAALASSLSQGGNVVPFPNRKWRGEPGPEHANVFVSYCKCTEDNRHYTLLDKQFTAVVRSRGFVVWAKENLRPGDRKNIQIKAALVAAQVAVLLVSVNYLSQPAITSGELPYLLHEAKDKGKRIMPVILDPCGFDYAPGLSEFQPFNDSSSPASAMSVSERKWFFLRVAEEVLGELRARKG
jgi:hypothetical protein